MASTTTPQSRESHKKLKPKPKTESKSWQTRNMARPPRLRFLSYGAALWPSQPWLA